MAKKRSKTKAKKKSRSRDRSRRKHDSKKLQKRLKRSQERAQGGMRSIIKADADVTLFRPKDGSHIIDIIPYFAGSNDPITEEGDDTYTLETWVHGGIGPDNAVMLCPQRMYNKECPICDHRQSLRDKGADEDVWKKLFPRCRHLYNVVSYDRGEEKKGVQVFDVSYHYSEKHIIPLSKRPTRGGKERTVNFADPEDGKSITFTIEPAKTKNDYPSYVGWSFEDREDYEIEDGVLDAVHCLDEIIKIPTAKEITDAYWGKEGKKKARKAKDDDDDDSDELEGLIEEVEDMDEMEELEDFIEEHDLDVKIKKKDDEDDVKGKIQEALDEQFGEEDPDEEEDDDDEPEYTKKQIRKMKKKKLLRLIDDEDLDVDPDDADDDEELQDMIIEELDL